MALDNLIYKIRSGSDLYGTTIKGKSDTDFLGVFIPSKDFILGTYRVEQHIERSNSEASGKANTALDSDYTCYSLPKFIHLLEMNNPTVLETLFAHDNCVLYCNDFGKMLIDNRDLFLSLKIKHSFCGYAYAQKSKMIYNENKTGARWKESKESGYSFKFAYHTIRLLHFGLQFLKEGTLSLPSPINKLLIDIKQGKYKLDDILGMYEKLNEQVGTAYLNSKLPTAPDKKKISNLQIEMLESFYKYK